VVKNEPGQVRRSGVNVQRDRQEDFNEYSQTKLSETQDYRISLPSDAGYPIGVGVTVIRCNYPGGRGSEAVGSTHAVRASARVETAEVGVPDEYPAPAEYVGRPMDGVRSTAGFASE
jgi:hypothetical protein